MDRLSQPRRDLKPVVAAAAIFFSTGLSIASMFLMTLPGMAPFGYPEARILSLTSSLVLLCACVLVFFRPNIGYGLGGIAALLGLPWFVLTESSSMVSIWSVLNGPDPFSEHFVPLARLKILSVALLATAVTCSVLRLLPPALLRRAHLSGRTWPAMAVGVVVPIVWLCHSAVPWMLPEIVDFGSSPDLRILHVQKRGLQFHETRVSTGRDGRFIVRHYDRRLFQYRFHGLDEDGVMPENTRQRVDALARSSTLGNLRTAPAVALRSWNAEGWYITTLHSPILAFTSEYGTAPPDEVRDLFEQIAQLPGAGKSFAIQDVCLGFCYDPIAGLGFRYWNQRCMTLPTGSTRCR